MTIPPSIKAEAEAAREVMSPVVERWSFEVGIHWLFTRLMQLSEGEFPKDTNVEYSDEAKAFVAKCFPCEPPCDSYGVCSNCAEETTFGAGYNFGARHQHALNAAKVLALEAEIARLTREMIQTKLVYMDQDDKCYACDKKLKSSRKLVDTRDGQKVFVGPDCFKKIRQAGETGYRPPKGGPRLWEIKN